MPKRHQDAPRRAWVQKKPGDQVDQKTRFDRLLIWFKNNKFFSLLMLAAVVITAVSQLFGSIAGLVQSSRSIIGSSPEHTIAGPATIEPGPDRPANDKVAKILLRVGSKGIGPGYFSDARLLQLDAAGEIVIDQFGDKSRLQRFDAQGKFITQWFPGELDVYRKDAPVTSMALSGAGVYLGTSGELARHDLESGRRLAAVTPQVDNLTDVEAVGSNPSGGIVSVWKVEPRGHVLVIYDAAGRVLRSAVQRLELPDDVENEFKPLIAVDGNGFIYLLDQAQSVVYKLTPAGVFSNHFGNQGDAVGQISSAPHAIAVDGKGEICVADFNGLQVFDTDGRFIERVLVPRETGEDEYGEQAMEFDGAGNLWVLYSDRLVEMTLP